MIANLYALIAEHDKEVAERDNHILEFQSKLDQLKDVRTKEILKQHSSLCNNINKRKLLELTIDTISIDQTREFDIEFFMSSPIGQALHFVIYALGYDNQILTTQHIEVSTKYSNIQTDFSMQVSNGKQVFAVNLKNNGEFATKTKLYIWLNETTYMIMDIAIEIGEEWTHSILFDEIRVSDSIVFYVTTEFEDINSTNKFAAFFSIQDEIQSPIDFINPYAGLLDNAKGLAF